MGLIDSSGRAIEDGWTYPDAQGNVAIRARAAVPIDVLTSLGPNVVAGRPAGAYLPAGAATDLVVPFLDQLDLVVVEFPKFRDGRGFTVARMLRERHGFKGDIRAIGHVLPDQFAALVQCGFSSIVTPAEHPPEQWQHGTRLESSSSAGGPLLQRLIGRRAALPGSAEEKSRHDDP